MPTHNSQTAPEAFASTSAADLIGRLASISVDEATYNFAANVTRLTCDHAQHKHPQCPAFSDASWINRLQPNTQVLRPEYIKWLTEGLRPLVSALVDTLSASKNPKARMDIMSNYLIIHLIALSDFDLAPLSDSNRKFFSTIYWIREHLSDNADHGYKTLVLPALYPDFSFTTSDVETEIIDPDELLKFHQHTKTCLCANTPVFAYRNLSLKNYRTFWTNAANFLAYTQVMLPKCSVTHFGRAKTKIRSSLMYRLLTLIPQTEFCNHATTYETFRLLRDVLNSNGHAPPQAIEAAEPSPANYRFAIVSNLMNDENEPVLLELQIDQRHRQIQFVPFDPTATYAFLTDSEFAVDPDLSTATLYLRQVTTGYGGLRPVEIPLTFTRESMTSDVFTAPSHTFAVLDAFLTEVLIVCDRYGLLPVEAAIPDSLTILLHVHTPKLTPTGTIEGYDTKTLTWKMDQHGLYKCPLNYGQKHDTSAELFVSAADPNLGNLAFPRKEMQPRLVGVRKQDEVWYFRQTNFTMEELLSETEFAADDLRSLFTNDAQEVAPNPTT